MTRLYVGNLASRATERDIEKFFRDYGHVRDIVIKDRYGFVEFDRRRDAEDACYELNGKYLLGERVIIEIAKASMGSGMRNRKPRGGGYGPPTRTKYRMLIKNLSSKVSWQDLKDLMRKVGDVTFADAHKLRPNEGIVEFSSASDLRNAIEKYDDYELKGRHLECSKDESAGDYRSKSRSRSRSRLSARSRSRDSFRNGNERSQSGSRSRSRS